MSAPACTAPACESANPKGKTPSGVDIFPFSELNNGLSSPSRMWLIRSFGLPTLSCDASARPLRQYSAAPSAVEPLHPLSPFRVFRDHISRQRSSLAGHHYSGG